MPEISIDNDFIYKIDIIVETHIGNENRDDQDY